MLFPVCNQNEVSEVKSAPDSDSFFFEDSENEDDIMYESDSDLDETNDNTTSHNVVPSKIVL